VFTWLRSVSKIKIYRRCIVALKPMPIVEEQLSRSSLLVLGEIGAVDRRTDGSLIHRSTVIYSLVGMLLDTRSRALSAVEMREDEVVLNVESLSDCRLLSALLLLCFKSPSRPSQLSKFEGLWVLGRASDQTLFFHYMEAIARRVRGGLVSVASVSSILPA
jgi:hypothetical protein